MTLIGELPYEIGQISVNGRVAFCAQEPWLFSGSVRENVVFGDSYDADRYQMVVKACSLTKVQCRNIQTFIYIQGCTLTGFRHRPAGYVRQEDEPTQHNFNQIWPLIIWRIEDICVLSEKIF